MCAHPAHPRVGPELLDFVTDDAVPHLGGNLRHGDHNTLDIDVWRALIERFAVRSVLDVGCGEGHAVWNLARMGVVAHGIDGLRLNVERAVYPIAHHDLSSGPYFMPVDLVISFEVAEHVNEAYAGHFLDTLANGKIVALTHALPGEDTGHHHKNCQPPEYWIERMGERGYLLDAYTFFWREMALRRNPDSFFGKSGLVFKRRDAKPPAAARTPARPG